MNFDKDTFPLAEARKGWHFVPRRSGVRHCTWTRSLGWHGLGVLLYERGSAPVEIGYCTDPRINTAWCVQFHFHGKYFKRRADLETYLKDAGWLHD